jgi:hypothetical protein
MINKGITMSVLVNGKPVSEYSKNGNKYIEGRKKSEYILRVYNSTYNKVLVIPSVDGLSVLDGKSASFDSPGMILDAFSGYDFTGWRTDLEHIRKFVFGSKKKSYSNKTGQGTTNLGVIGLVAFQEKVIHNYYPISWQDPTIYNIRDYNTADNSGGLIGATFTGAILQNSCEPVAASIGTEMGDKQDSVVTAASFHKQDSPYTTISIYYNEKKQLEKMGIVIKKKYSMPQAFPQEFCEEV